MLKISILIVTKNRSTLLRECLRSLVAQRIKPWEVVVVDNGSTDNSKMVIQGFCDMLPIKYNHTMAVGYPSVYNNGIKKTSGDWIVFFDDDCIADPEWYSNIIQAITKYPNMVIQGRTKSIPAGNIYAEIMGDHYENWISVNMVDKMHLRTLDNKNLCVPLSVIKALGGFDEIFTDGCEDLEMGARYHRHGVPIIYDSSIVGFHHERGTLREFVIQHIRIARSEAFLDSRLPHKEGTQVVYRKKIFLHMKKAFRREIMYVRNGNLLYAFQLPFLYALLIIIRLWKYYVVVVFGG
jgi:glycosyltransferase involved in cell wall biosynthesis